MIMNKKFSNNDVFLAKTYMIEYKFLVETHKLYAGIIGRFFERIFCTSVYKDIEKELKIKYGLSYSNAFEVLYYTNNKKYIYKI